MFKVSEGIIPFTYIWNHMYYSKVHPITDRQGPRGGVEV
jgi:hypothetical protein